MVGLKAVGWGTRLAALAVVLVCATPAWAQSNASTSEASTPAVRVRLGVNAQGTRVVIDSPAEISATPTKWDQGRIEFAVTGLSLVQPLTGDGAGLVKAWLLKPAASGAILTLDLAGQGAVAHRFAIPPTVKFTQFRYVIDLVSGIPAGAEVITAAAEKPRPRRTVAAGLGSLPVSVRTQARKVVVIDAGHGGHDPGAQSGEVNEKDITLAAALRLRHRLERDGRYRVVMTRSSDVFVPLEERVRIARRAGADLFIALHADSAGGDGATHGASVYTLSDHAETRVSEVLGGHEWFKRVADRNDPAVGGILLDLTQRSTLNRSNEFAQILVERLSDKIDLLPRTHRDAGYFVLLAPDVPAVLLEMGFISNPIDVARLTDQAQRNALIDTVAQAIDAYFDGEVRLAAD